MDLYESTREYYGFDYEYQPANFGHDSVYPLVVALLRIGIPAIVIFAFVRSTPQRRWAWTSAIGPAIIGGALGTHARRNDPFSSAVVAALGLGLPGTLYVATRRAFTMNLKVKEWWPRHMPRPTRDTSRGQETDDDKRRSVAAEPAESPGRRTGGDVVLAGLAGFSIFMLLLYAEGMLGLLSALVYSIPASDSTHYLFGDGSYGLGPSLVYPRFNWLLRIATPIVIAMIGWRSTNRRIWLSLLVPSLLAGTIAGWLSTRFLDLDSFYAGAVAGLPAILYLSIRAARSTRTADFFPPAHALTAPSSSLSIFEQSQPELAPRTRSWYLRVIWAFVASLYLAFALFLLIVFAEGLLGLLGTWLYILFMKSPWRFFHGEEWHGPRPGDDYFAIPMLLLSVGLPMVVAILIRRKGTRERWVWTLALVPAIVGGPLYSVYRDSNFAGFYLACGAGMPAALYLAFVAGRSVARRLTGPRAALAAAMRPAS
jgi:hypothetical protein